MLNNRMSILGGWVGWWIENSSPESDPLHHLIIRLLEFSPIFMDRVKQVEWIPMDNFHLNINFKFKFLFIAGYLFILKSQVSTTFKRNNRNV